MTPTLLGRWQTRLLLLATIGVLVTIPFSLGIIGPGTSSVFFWILVYVALLGCLWDILYSYLQRFRWDRDWPGALQLLTGIWEGIFIAFWVRLIGLPNGQEFSVFWFIIHYSLVWLSVYIASQMLMRILFPRWRFKGGQWL
ncbi:MAG: hypothetical protein AB1589_03805 [Cyanobacteriota bacterium]